MGTMALMGAGPTAPVSTLITAYTDIAGCYAWYEAQKEAYSNGNAVGSLTDWSARTNTATQATGSAKPTFVTGEVNSLAAISWDGGDYLTKTSATGIGAGALTFVGILKRVGTGTRRTIIYTGDSTNGGRQIVIDSSEKLRLTKSQITEVAGASASVSNSAYELWALTYDGSTYTFYRNGAQDSTGSASQTFVDTVPVIYVGTNTGSLPSEPANDKKPLLLLYDTVLSGTDLGRVFARANADYAIY